MFGLEKKSDNNANRNNKNQFIFDLENEIKDIQKKKALQSKVEERIQFFKKQLRSGEDQEAFNKLGVFLHGYSALLKVIGRVKN